MKKIKLSKTQILKSSNPQNYKGHWKVCNSITF